MKIAKLLVMSVLCCFGMSAIAADLTERIAPEVPAMTPLIDDASAIDRTPVAFEVGKLYVLYNVGEQKFFSQGCNWATQASTSEVPLVVRFTLPDGKSLSDAALLFTDYNRFTNSWKEVFYDSPTGMFTDRGSQEVSYFQVVAKENNTYRIQASAANNTYNPEAYPGFVGRDAALVDQGDLHGRDVGTPDAMPVSPFLDEAEGHYIDWQFFALPEYAEWDAYFEAQAVYNKASELKTLIGRAEEAGVDVADAVAVYNNEAATIAELQTAIDTLYGKMTGGIGSGTAENPSDATTLINNPNFDNASSAGWSGTGPGMSGDGNHAAANVAEHYNKTFDTYQALEGMPNGVYALKAYTFFRGQVDDFLNGTNQQFYPYLYAVAGDSLKTLFNNAYSPMNTEPMAGPTEFGTTAAEASASVSGMTVYIPNDPSAFRLYEEKGYYATTVFFDVADGKATIGVKKDQKQTDTDWAVFDTFSLKFYGNTAESYQKWVELSAPAFAENTVCTASVMDAYNALVASSKGSATDKASAIAGVEAIKNSAELAALNENVAAWRTYMGKVEEAKTYTTNPEFQAYAGDIADYVFDSEDIINSKSLSTAELQSEIAKVDEMILAVVEAAKEDIKAGDDVTERYLANAKFENAGNGWEGGSSITAFASGCAEAYEKNPFDLYQEVQGVKPGVYEISLQGFFRNGPNESAYPEYKEAKASGNTIPAVAWVYLNTNKTALKNVYDIEGDERIAGNPSSDPECAAASFYVTNNGPAAWTGTDNNGMDWTFPNGMGSSHDCFEAQMYTSKAYGLVKEGETLRIGIKGNLGSYQWAIWDDFSLVYKGYDADVIKPILEEAVANMSADKPMAKSVYEKVAVVKAAAEQAIASNDGNAMFEALSNIFDLNEEITTSVTLFGELKSQAESLLSAASMSMNANAAAAAETLATDVLSKSENHEIDTEEVDTYKAQMNRAMKNLYKQEIADMDLASDEAPVDATGLIVANGYDIDGANSNLGWEGTVGNFGANDEQKVALAYEFFNITFDHFQDIEDIPNGTYQVSVNAFGRIGSIENDYTQTQEAPGTNESYMYAVSGDQTFDKPLVSLFSDALTEDPGYSGQATYDGADGVTYYIPNDMVSAVAFFGEGCYVNSLIVKVTDNKLRVGVKKDVNTDTGWVLVDNWTLTYFGENSSKPTDPSGIDDMNSVPTMKVEYFTLDGRKVFGQQKGIMIQKQTLGNGSVIVKKIRK